MIKLTDVKRWTPPAMLCCAAFPGCLTVYISLEQRSISEGAGWAFLAMILAVQHRRSAGSWQLTSRTACALLILVLLVALLTVRDIRQEVSPWRYAALSSAIAGTRGTPEAERLRGRVRAALRPDGTLTRWDYAPLDRYMNDNDYTWAARLDTSRAEERARLHALLAVPVP